MKKSLLFSLVLACSMPLAAQDFSSRVKPFVPNPDLNAAQSALAVQNTVVMVCDNTLLGANAENAGLTWSYRSPYMLQANALTESYSEGYLYLHALKNQSTKTSIIYKMEATTGLLKDSTAIVGTAILQLHTRKALEDKGLFACLGTQKGLFVAAVLDRNAGKTIRTFVTESSAPAMYPVSMALSSDGSTCAVALLGDKSEIRLYDWESAKLKKTIPLEKGTEVQQMRFCQNNMLLLVPNGKDGLLVFNTESGSLLAKAITNEKHAFLALSSDESKVVLSGLENASIAYVSLPRFQTGQTSLQLSSVEKSIYKCSSLSCHSTSDMAFVSSRSISAYRVSKIPYCYSVAFSGNGNQDFVTGEQMQANKAPFNPSVGQRVFALYKADGKYYSGTVTAKNATSCTVLYDDNSSLQLPFESLKPLPALAVGMRVQARWTDGKFYAAKVLSLEGEKVNIVYDDGVKQLIEKKNIMQVE